MAPSSSNASLTNMAVVLPVFGVATAASVAFAGRALLAQVQSGDVRAWLVRLATGPGRTSRALLLALALLNLKSLPFAWTVRIFGAMLRHMLWPRPPLPPRALFHYSITRTHTSLLETDYNLHKSNSTYFSDLDTSRMHLVMYLLGPGVTAASNNATTRLVADPGNPAAPMPGSFGVGLGAVTCSFRREISPYQPYEIWSRLLAWDRKWMYVLSHFVPKGAVKPPSWDGKPTPTTAGTAGTKPWTPEDEAALQKHVFATAISKYVFKLGRFTVHPSYLIEASGLLPERPGEGWRGGGPEAVGNMADLDDSDDTDSGEDGVWTWKNVERERRRGMAFAEQFSALDDATALFNGGKNGALGIFGPG